MLKSMFEDMLECMNCGKVFAENEADKEEVSVAVFRQFGIVEWPPKCPWCGSEDLKEYEEEEGESDE